MANIYIYMGCTSTNLARQSFFDSWTASDGTKWKSADGSSLTSSERSSLTEDCVVIHKKREHKSKFFAINDGQLLSVIVLNTEVKKLSEALQGLDYTITAVA